MKKSFEQIAKEDGRYNARAFGFVFDGLGYTAKNIIKDTKHVSIQNLCEGLRKFGTERWGYLAMLVLNSWGITTTRDFGEIIWLMIKNEWMSAQPTDSIDDSDNVYDFKTVFKDQFEF